MSESADAAPGPAQSTGIRAGIAVVSGGIVAAADARHPKAKGVAATFGPGVSLDAIAEALCSCIERARCARPADGANRCGLTGSQFGMAARLFRRARAIRVEAGTHQARRKVRSDERPAAHRSDHDADSVTDTPVAV